MSVPCSPLSFCAFVQIDKFPVKYVPPMDHKNANAVYLAGDLIRLCPAPVLPDHARLYTIRKNQEEISIPFPLSGRVGGK